MRSTKRTGLFLSLFFIGITSTTRSNAQRQKFIGYFDHVANKISVESALIRINNKDASYTDMLKIPDSALLKIEVYPKKEAIKIAGKDEGKNGLLLITLRKGDMFQYNINKPPNHLIISNQGDTVNCEHLNEATLDGDTSGKSWNQFLVKNLKAGTPAENGSPPGIYIVDFSFTVNKDGTVSNVKIFEDPGYGCGSEVRRLMKQSPLWVNAICEGDAINYKEEERITFLVSEN